MCDMVEQSGLQEPGNRVEKQDRARQTESILAARTEELQAAYQQLQASESELKFAYIQLKESRNALAAREAHFRSLIENALDGICIIGPDGSILARSFGNDPQEAVAEIDPAAAGDKCVAPATDIFEGRDVEQYRF